MNDFLLEHYNWIKALHIFAMVCWMAGLLYLPRLFVYHCRSAAGSPQSDTFILMEGKLLKIIMNPAMIATWGLGLLMFFVQADALMQAGWLHVKILLVIILSGLHMFFARCRRNFAAGRNSRSEGFYRKINEVPAIVLLAIVILAVVKPF